MTEISPITERAIDHLLDCLVRLQGESPPYVYTPEGQRIWAASALYPLVAEIEKLRVALTVAESRLANYGRHHGWCESQTASEGAPCNCGFIEALASTVPTQGTERQKVYEVVKFVNPRDAARALDGMAVHAVAGPHDADAHGILVAHVEHGSCMVSFHDVLTDEETLRTDIRNFVEIIVP